MKNLILTAALILSVGCTPLHVKIAARAAADCDRAGLSGDQQCLMQQTNHWRHIAVQQQQAFWAMHRANMQQHNNNMARGMCAANGSC